MQLDKGGMLGSIRSCLGAHGDVGQEHAQRCDADLQPLSTDG